MISKDRIELITGQITQHMETEWLPFWESRGCDTEFGGYFTDYDASGKKTEDSRKFIVTQARMIWCYSLLYSFYPDREDFRMAARQGVDFMLNHFWDRRYEGWVWLTDREGNVLDDGKVVYGEGFMIYALAQYGLSTGDPRGKEYACRTFDLLQKYAVDTFNGGYYENLEPDWTISEPGYAAGDRKSLDIHMHLLEAFTTLYKLTGEEIHKRKLNEVIDIILKRMVNQQDGCGRNQFDLAFNPIPAICIRRTWNDDRGKGESVDEPLDTTSYGHNVELAWLLNRAAAVMGDSQDRFAAITRALNDHALRYGLDPVYGGVYRDGPHQGEAIIHDKEWWQNCEVLVGLLDAYEILGDDRYWDAFEKCWDFDNRYMINHEVGEWRQLLKQDGTPIISDMGNPWKAMYHTGRSLMECRQRLKRLAEKN